MSKIGIGNVSYTPIWSSEEMKLEIKTPSANEVLKNMWDKLNYDEKILLNTLVDNCNKNEKEIERLQAELDKTRLSELDKEYKISKAIEHIEKSWNDKCTVPLEEVGYSTDNRWEIWKILKGDDKE